MRNTSLAFRHFACSGQRFGVIFARVLVYLRSTCAGGTCTKISSGHTNLALAHHPRDAMMANCETSTRRFAGQNVARARGSQQNQEAFRGPAGIGLRMSAALWTYCIASVAAGLAVVPVSASAAASPESAPATSTPTADTVVPRRRARESGQAIEFRLGTVLPSQVLDGPGLRTTAAYSIRLASSIWFRAESGLERVTMHGLTTDVSAPGATTRIRADSVQWNWPTMVGLAWVPQLHNGWSWSAFGGAGIAWSWTKTEASVVGFAPRRESTDSEQDLVIGARLDLRRAFRAGDFIVGIAWESTPFAGTEKRRHHMVPEGALLEAGWRIGF